MITMSQVPVDNMRAGYMKQTTTNKEHTLMPDVSDVLQVDDQDVCLPHYKYCGIDADLARYHVYLLLE